MYSRPLLPRRILHSELPLVRTRLVIPSQLALARETATAILLRNRTTCHQGATLRRDMARDEQPFLLWRRSCWQ
jgi:hypothetical protein